MCTLQWNPWMWYNYGISKKVEDFRTYIFICTHLGHVQNLNTLINLNRTYFSDHLFLLYSRCFSYFWHNQRLKFLRFKISAYVYIMTMCETVLWYQTMKEQVADTIYTQSKYQKHVHGIPQICYQRQLV